MRIKGSGTPGHERGLAMALAGNGRWCYLDPKLGAMHAVAEAARKVACTGATPVAATNCLNFGNPEKPEIMAQLSAAIDGIAEACTALGTPITGGNVSLYNETQGRGDLSDSGGGGGGDFGGCEEGCAGGVSARGRRSLLLRRLDAYPDVQIEFEEASLGRRSLLGLDAWDRNGVRHPHLDLGMKRQLQQVLQASLKRGLLTPQATFRDGGSCSRARQGVHWQAASACACEHRSIES